MGPGAAPLLEASIAWDAVAASLASSVSMYSSTVMELAAAWIGPSAIAMGSAATEYTVWLTQMAAQSEETANLARAAAAAYETAFAATVPPPLIAENRSQLMMLVATNFLGINTPAILATEAQYMEMWAQDVAAMTEYQGASLVATSSLPVFVPATPNTNPGGMTAQAASVAMAAATPAGDAVSSMGGLLSDPLMQTLNGYAQNFVASGAWNPWMYASSFMSMLGQSPGTLSPAILGGGVTAGAASVGVPKGAPFSAGSGSSPVSASMGAASRAGSLSVPQGWSSTSGGARLSSMATSLGPNSATPTPAAPGVFPTPIAAVSAPKKGGKQHGEDILAKMKFLPMRGI